MPETSFKEKVAQIMVNVETEMFQKYENKNKLLLTKWRNLDDKAKQAEPKQKFINAVKKVITY